MTKLSSRSQTLERTGPPSGVGSVKAAASRPVSAEVRLTENALSPPHGWYYCSLVAPQRRRFVGLRICSSALGSSAGPTTPLRSTTLRRQPALSPVDSHDDCTGAAAHLQDLLMGRAHFAQERKPVLASVGMARWPSSNPIFHGPSCDASPRDSRARGRSPPGGGEALTFSTWNLA